MFIYLENFVQKNGKCTIRASKRQILNIIKFLNELFFFKFKRFKNENKLKYLILH